MKTLYLGLEVPASSSDRTIVHCPLIQIVPLHTTEVLEVVSRIPQYTHLLFTSKSAVQLLVELYPGDLRHLTIYSIGSVTTQHLLERGISPHRTAVHECSEGVIELLQGEDLESGHLFWPHSARSRPVIADYLRARGVAFTECHLYDTVAVSPDPLPNLEEFDELVFTSPSTVEAFFRLFSSIPSHLQVKALGPITAKSLNRSYV